LTGFLPDTNAVSTLVSVGGVASATSPASGLEQMNRDGRLFLSAVTIREIERAEPDLHIRMEGKACRLISSAGKSAFPSANAHRMAS